MLLPPYRLTAKMVTKHPTLPLNQPVTGALNRDSMWERNLHNSFKTIDARWCLENHQMDGFRFMRLPACTNLFTFRGRGEAEPPERVSSSDPVVICCCWWKISWSRAQFHHKPKLEEARVQRKRQEEGSIRKKMTFRGCRSDKNWKKPSHKPITNSVWPITNGHTQRKLPDPCLSSFLLPSCSWCSVSRLLTTEGNRSATGQEERHQGCLYP